MCYINCTTDHCLSGFVGDGPSALRLRVYADADFAGDRPEFKSTSGVFLAMVGPNTFFPLAAKAQKQTAVAHSTVEAEIVSANFAVRTIGLPALDLWETVFERSVALTLIEDNESTAAIIRTGRNPTMRHLSRTHGVNVSWLHDLYERKKFGVVYTRTEAQCADVFTKTFRELPKWQQAIRLIGIGRPTTACTLPPEPGPRPDTLEKKKQANQPLASDELAAMAVSAAASSRPPGSGSGPGGHDIVHVSFLAEDNWRTQKNPHRALPYRWGGRTSFEVSDGTWRTVEHDTLRRALMTPTHLTLPSGLRWTGWRLTHVRTIQSLDTGDRAAYFGGRNKPPSE